MKSPINFFKLKPFSLPNLPLYEFTILGDDKNTKGLNHIVYLTRNFVDSKCEVKQTFIEINTNCKQFLILNAGIVVGCLFVAKQVHVICQKRQLEIGKMKSTKGVETLHFLEDFGLLLFKSLDGCVLAISRHITDPLVATIRDEDMQKGEALDG